MRMHKIIIDGEHHSTVPAGINTAEELQHEISQRSGKRVRVLEFIIKDPPKHEQRWEEDPYGD